MTDIRVPIKEIRQYLVAKFESRFSLHPKKLEEVVASVFASLGYESRVTGYGVDGGIDVVLYDSNGNAVGVQVKRYKNSIKVEQIRAFIGALTLAEHTKGIFVTTSRYQAGAAKAVKISKKKCISIQLINAVEFLNTLKVAQEIESKNNPEFFMPFDITRPPKFSFLTEYHLGSL